MLIQAILVAILATISNWWFSHLVTRTMLYPLWAGFLTGLLMGDPIMGMKCGAYINLAYLGWITAGGTMPGNLPVAGVFGTALTILSGKDPSLAVTFAVPFSLFGLLSWNLYMTINAFWVHKAEKYAQEGNIKGIVLLNYIPSLFLSILINGVPAFIMIAYLGTSISGLVQTIPENIITSLECVGALMPALGIAMLLNYMGKKEVLPFFFLGFFITAYLKLDIMAVTIFASIIALMIYLFNKTEVKNNYDDKEIESIKNLKNKLTKSDLIKHYILGYSSETCYNYERLQALGRASAASVLVNRLYKTEKEKGEAIKKYFVFFNTEPSWVGTIIHGIEAGMEEQIANGYQINEESFNAVRTGLMGPIAGIGDTVSQGIAYPILAGICCTLSIEGNLLGPILFEIGYKVLMIVSGWNFYKFGYKNGKNSVIKFLKEGILDKVTKLFSIVGLMVIGNMAFSRINIETAINFGIGKAGDFVLQDVFNMLFPGFIPLIFVMITWLMVKKLKPTSIIIIIFVVGILMSLTGIITTI